MKQTKLMRTLSSRNRSKVFSAKLNKAFDEAIENGSSELVDANNDLAIATVGNDIVVEDKINNEITKFTPNPEVENDMVMEAIVDTPEVSNEQYCNTGRRFSDNEEPMATENYKNTPVVGLSSDTHEINTIPEVEVVVNEGVIDNEESGTIPFSLRLRNVPRSRVYSITRAIRKAFSDEEGTANVSNEAVQNIANAVVNAVNEKVENIVNEVVEEVKTESKRTRKAFCDGQMNEDTADAIVNAVVNEVKNIVANEVKNATNEVKNESRRSKRFADEANAANNTVNNAVNDAANEAVNNAANEAVNNAVNNAANDAVNEVENLKNEIKEDVTENVVNEVTDELEQLVNDAIVEPKADITETEEVLDKAESKKFSASRSTELSKLLNAKF